MGDQEPTNQPANESYEEEQFEEEGDAQVANSSESVPVPEASNSESVPVPEAASSPEVPAASSQEATGAESSSVDQPAAPSQEASDIPGTMHTAAQTGSVEGIKYLLSKKADPTERNQDGLTPLQVAEANGQDAAAKLLRDAMPANAKAEPEEFEDEFEDDAPEKPPANVAAAPPADVPADAPTTDPRAQQDDIPETIGEPEVDQTQLSPPQASKSAPNSPSFKSGGIDLKKKTDFGGTIGGVLKRTTFMHSISTFRTGPKYTMVSRGAGTFIRSSSTPAPGTYNLPMEEKSKFKAPPKFSFGSGSRFGLGASPLKKQPDPGTYNPFDPALHTDTKVGFGTSTRGKMVLTANPGPGAYEVKNTVGEGKMFTARGRHATSYLRSRSMPGPGAYTPQDHFAVPTAPKCGFGTSTRDDMVSRNARSGMMPGPGSYELQNFATIGKDSKKFSATSRRKMHDLNSYVTPGPGTYNSHVTSFGY